MPNVGGVSMMMGGVWVNGTPSMVIGTVGLDNGCGGTRAGSDRMSSCAFELSTGSVTGASVGTCTCDSTFLAFSTAAGSTEFAGSDVVASNS